MKKQPTSTDYLFVQKYICENINKTQPKTTNSIFTINAIQAIDCAIRAAFECNIGSVPAYISAALKFAHKFISENPKKEFEAICIVNDACEEHFASLENPTQTPNSIKQTYIWTNPEEPSEQLEFVADSLGRAKQELVLHLMFLEGEADVQDKDFHIKDILPIPNRAMQKRHSINAENRDALKEAIEGPVFSINTTYEIDTELMSKFDNLFKDFRDKMAKKMENVPPNYRWTNPNNQDENVEVFAADLEHAKLIIREKLKGTIIIFVSDQDIQPIINE